jgi:serine/threonine protein kinase
MSTPSLEELKRIEDVLDRFESGWRRGVRPRIEEFAAELAGPLRGELVRQLLPVEIQLRRERGETPSAVEYYARLPADADAIRDVFGLGLAATDGPAIRQPAEVSGGPPPSRGPWPQLSGYLIQDVIGGGGMGVVYKAWQTTLGRNVAVKVIAPGASSERFAREARLIARINSPHVVVVHDYLNLPDRRALLVMDYIDGVDLRAAINEHGGRLPEDSALPMMAQVCEGMMAAAEQGIIHRDLKPANILIDRRGRALVADFGLARGNAGLADLSRSEHVVGTPYYMAPEQAEDPRGVDTRADIYSFGATFYHALTGVPPYDGPSAFAVLYKHKTEPLISPRARNPEISERTSDLIERCLAKAPGDRFPSFADVLRQLTTPSGLLSPWIMAEDRELKGYLERYRCRRDAYLEGRPSLPPEGDCYAFPRDRVIRILRGSIIDQDAEALVSSSTSDLPMDAGVSWAIRAAAGPSVAAEAERFVPVRPGRAVVTSAGRLPARFVFHGVTMGYSSDRWVMPSRDLIAEILASCFYHADTLHDRSIAFPLLGTGVGGFPRDVCLDTTFQFLAREFLHGLTCVEEARIVVYDGPD